MREQLCPDCGLRLTLGRLGPAVLDYCATCHGAWLGTGALQELLVGGEAAARRLQDQAGYGAGMSSAREPEGGCPGCGEPLMKVVAPELPRTPIFACPDCRGFWLTAATQEELAQRTSERRSAALRRS